MIAIYYFIENKQSILNVMLLSVIHSSSQRRKIKKGMCVVFQCIKGTGPG